MSEINEDAEIKNGNIINDVCNLALKYIFLFQTLAFGVLARLTFYQHKGGKPSRIHPSKLYPQALNLNFSSCSSSTNI